MQFLKKFFPSKKIKIMLAALDQLESESKNPFFYLVKKEVQKEIHSDPTILDFFKTKGWTPHEGIEWIALTASKNLIRSGEYGLYREVLNPIGLDLIRIYLFIGARLSVKGKMTPDEWGHRKDEILQGQKNFKFTRD